MFVSGGLETLRAAPTDVVINEILYHPDPDNSGSEFVELFNRGDTAVNLGGWSLTQAISFSFAAGTTLESGAYLAVARSPEDAKAFCFSDANDRTGSHHLIVGSEHSYSSYGGLVAGWGNTISGTYSSVSGGWKNSASGPLSSVSGGQDRVVTGTSDWRAGTLFEDQ